MTASVYVVDDDAAVADSIVTLLSLRGIACRHFATADLFLAALEGLEPGCILLDIFMPGTDGIDTLRALRARGLAWPVIVMTSDDDPTIEDFAWVAGAVEFLPKPFEGASLLRTVNAQLRRLEGPAQG